MNNGVEVCTAHVYDIYYQVMFFFSCFFRCGLFGGVFFFWLLVFVGVLFCSLLLFSVFFFFIFQGVDPSCHCDGDHGIFAEFER